ncbi:MAG: SRPBCC family protein [Actinomycetes bacterium]
MSINVRASLDAEVSPERLFAVIRDLETYPQWLDIVHVAQSADLVDGLQSWNVELRAKIGPFARSKRLRMVRTTDESPNKVVFERRERDGRKHAPWVLRSVVSEANGVSTLNVHLHYGGSLFDGGLVERVLADQIVSGKAKLKQFLAG